MCNKVLRDAVKSLTGLGDNELSNVLNEIRKKIKEDKKLVVLIEDISTLAVLDKEILNALFEQNDSDLCNLVSVVGMTEPGYKRLADNEYDRIHRVITFANSEEKLWFENNENFLKFNARYLNSLRLEIPQIEEISKNRKLGGDISITGCQNCKIKDKCFKIFGFVEFTDDIKVGLFPLNKNSLTKLIDNIEDDRLAKKLKEDS